MTQKDIKSFLDAFATKRERTMVIVDYRNVEKWKNSLGWIVDIEKLALLVKHFSYGRRANRRFYYGSDFGPNEKSITLTDWSRRLLEKAAWSKFDVQTKRVKYMKDSDAQQGYEKKCDLDVEMTVDLIKERDAYDHIVLFSGDGDLMYAVRYLKEVYGKSCVVFGARDHIGREVIDALKMGCLDSVLYAQDFEYRLRKGWQSR